MPVACVSQNGTVLVVTRDRQLFIWDSLSRLVEIDTTVPDYHAELLPSSVEQPPRMMSRHLSPGDDPPLFFHPSDPGTFFVVAVWPGVPGLLIVYQFKLVDRQYVLSQFFSFDIENFAFADSAQSREDASYSLEVRKADAHGTFRLLKVDLSATRGRDRFKFLLFNVFTLGFSVVEYNSPHSGFQHEYSESMALCLWAGQLILSYDTLVSDRSAMMMIALNPTKAPSPRASDHGFWSTMRHKLFMASEQEQEADPTRRDIISHHIKTIDNAIWPNYHSVYGVQYASSLCLKHCTHSGDHEPPCRRYRSDSCASADPQALTHVKQGWDEPWSGLFGPTEMVKIYSDDDYLVAVTSERNYTVFAVDPDGKWPAPIHSHVQDDAGSRSSETPGVTSNASSS